MALETQTELDAWRIFQAVLTQRDAAVGLGLIPLSLRYGDAMVAVRYFGFRPTPRVFEVIQHLEQVMLKHKGVNRAG